VNGRVAFLDTTIVTPPKQDAVLVKEGCADRNASFGQSRLCFLYGDIEHGLVVKSRCHASPSSVLS
jgi:hypothetical protein